MLMFLIENDVFLHLFNLSVTASFLALAVICLRLLLKKAPKWISCLLWGLVGLRLIFPFSIESIFSLIPSAQTVSPDIVYEAEPTISSGITAVDAVVNPIIIQTFAPSTDMGNSVNPMQVVVSIATLIWFLGVIAMVSYMLIGYIRLRFRLRTAVKMCDNIFQSERVSSPFIFGTVRPRIYLPFSMDESDMEYVIAHEKAHLARFDHLTKIFSYLILSVYWFNPLLWLAYILLCRDIELACDEKVVREMETAERKAYSLTLLKCSMQKHQHLACPLAFGEVGVKERVKNVMNYKKPAFWIILLAVVAIVVTAVCFLTVPEPNDKKDSIQIYRPDAIVGYDDYAFVTDSNHPISAEHYYLIENVNHNFFKQKNIGSAADWVSVGSLVECRMNKNKMKALFTEKFYFTGDGFLSVEPDYSFKGTTFDETNAHIYNIDGGSSLEKSNSFQKLVDENETVYRIENNTEWLGYLFCQENGDVYWGFGYEDDGLIRVLWKLQEVSQVETSSGFGYYQAIEDIGSHMAFSWYVSASETPNYYIDGNNRLFEQERGTTEWMLLGTLQEIELSEAQKQLVKLLEIPFMFEDERGTGGDSETRTLILENIAHMWTLTKEYGEGAWSYIFIQLDDGTMFLGKGHDGILRWLYRMERVETYDPKLIPQVSAASIVSTRALRSDMDVKATIGYDDRYVTLIVSFEILSEDVSLYYNGNSVLGKIVSEEVSIYQGDSAVSGEISMRGHDERIDWVDGGAPFFLGRTAASRTFIIDRDLLEDGKYRLHVFFALESGDLTVENAPCAEVVFELQNFE
ncbi:MAG: hypothetical protein IJ489_09240 [Clostridia bacterium]|nr:hypothetical protein [Clostridia bacterium]